MVRKALYLLALLLLFAGRGHAQTIQCQTSSGAWGPCTLNASIQLFTTQAATGTATATAQKVYNFSASGTFIVVYAGITGSPAGCTFQVKNSDSLGNVINNGGTISTVPANGTTTFDFTASTNLQNTDQITVTFACGTYPTAGTLSLEFVPSTSATKKDPNGRPIDITYPDTTSVRFRASKKFAASSTTDNFVLPGNATNTVIMTRLTLTCTETTASIINVEVIKRSSADTGGTSATFTIPPTDSNFAAAVSAPLSYTGTGPTAGSSVGDLDNAQVGCGTATNNFNDIYVYLGGPVILRGTAQQVAINLGGAITGGNITVTVEWIETTTP